MPTGCDSPTSNSPFFLIKRLCVGGFAWFLGLLRPPGRSRLAPRSVVRRPTPRIFLQVEALEDRTLLSAGSNLLSPQVLFQRAVNTGQPAPRDGVHSLALPNLSPPFSPQQIRHTYGIDQISFGGVVGDGSGQTI